MSVNWNWNAKCGEMILERNVDGEPKRKFNISLYEGNCLLIMINEFVEDGVEKYNLYSFFADETHAKRCLGLVKNCDKEYSNMFEDGWDKLVKIRINKKKSHNWKKIVTLFAQAFDNIDIEIFSEDGESA